MHRSDEETYFNNDPYTTLHVRQRKYVVESREIDKAQIEKAATAKNAMTPFFLSPRSGTSTSREEAPVVITLNIVLLGLATTYDLQRFTAAQSIALRKAVLHSSVGVCVYVMGAPLNLR